ncbi:hypothetical protein RBSWK_01859 [Rhodopirellula baltica SWK14]|uniref:Uncharacterized protein n=1 Tax=Rhodopirellula baltica SWK14 TaxID=993516 RepID=L7CKX7_RHOBT|nr:hypothetical protein RBSWK_01859 [Rhodopirellula baltica SWK14]
MQSKLAGESYGFGCFKIGVVTTACKSGNDRHHRAVEASVIGN